MKKENLEKIKKYKIVLVILILVALIGILHFIHPAEYMVEGDKNVKDNLTQLNKSIAKLDTNKIDSAISKASFTVKLKEVGGEKETLDKRFIFSECALVGDSMAEGIVDYGILDNTNVFAKRGKRLETADDLIFQAINSRPEQLFIEFGMNDIIAYRGKVEPFIKKYKSVIENVREKLPNTKLYIVAISTISPQGIAEQPFMKNFTGYNNAMEKMCKEEKIQFVDTTLLMDESSEYEFDGVHPKEPFYSNWVRLMCSYILESSEV